MKIKNYSFAGVEYQISMPENIMYTDERFLAHFAVESTENPHIFNFNYCEELSTEPMYRTYVLFSLYTRKPGFAVTH